MALVKLSIDNSRGSCLETPHTILWEFHYKSCSAFLDRYMNFLMNIINLKVDEFSDDECNYLENDKY